MKDTRATTVPVGIDALEQAISQAGGVTQFARSLDVSYQLVQGWRVRGRKYATPAEYALRVEAATGVPRHALRPDLYPAD